MVAYSMFDNAPCISIVLPEVMFYVRVQYIVIVILKTALTDHNRACLSARNTIRSADAVEARSEKAGSLARVES
jgi:hypothetical protein